MWDYVKAGGRWYGAFFVLWAIVFMVLYVTGATRTTEGTCFFFFAVASIHIFFEGYCAEKRSEKEDADRATRKQRDEEIRDFFIDRNYVEEKLQMLRTKISELRQREVRRADYASPDEYFEAVEALKDQIEETEDHLCEKYNLARNFGIIVLGNPQTNAKESGN